MGHGRRLVNRYMGEEYTIDWLERALKRDSNPNNLSRLREDNEERLREMLEAKNIKQKEAEREAERNPPIPPTKFKSCLKWMNKHKYNIACTVTEVSFLTVGVIDCFVKNGDMVQGGFIGGTL